MAERRKKCSEHRRHEGRESIGQEALEEAGHIGTRSPDGHVRAHVFGVKI